jgi:hypothetical protein
MFDELKKYRNNGHFFFKKGDSLKEVSKDVPDLPGVYYVIRLAKGKVNLVYIGRSGTIMNNGKFRDQGLHGRLNNKQDGMKRQEYFDLKFEQHQIEGLDIYWYVTFDNANHDLPGYIEGLIIQRFFELYNQLPEWNKEY